MCSFLVADLGKLLTLRGITASDRLNMWLFFDVLLMRIFSCRLAILTVCFLAFLGLLAYMRIVFTEPCSRLFSAMISFILALWSFLLWLN